MKIAFIGAGNMANALIGSLLDNGGFCNQDIVACEIDPTRRAAAARRFGIRVESEMSAAVRGATVVVPAVKPQSFAEVLPSIAPHLRCGCLVLSIAAGRRTTGIEKALPGARVVRAMPNLNCQVGEGMSVISPGRRARPCDIRKARRILACSGDVLELPERLLDAVTALSGSGPAFFAYLAGSLAAGAEAEGVAREDALRLAVQTMLGTARLLKEKKLTPEQLIAAVSSKRGTTVAGLTVLRRGPVRRAMRQTVAVAARRSRELSA